MLRLRSCGRRQRIACIFENNLKNLGKLWDWSYQVNFVGMRSGYEHLWRMARDDVYIRESAVVATSRMSWRGFALFAVFVVHDVHDALDGFSGGRQRGANLPEFLWD